jgi:16S rRNA processing protein RimM
MADERLLLGEIVAAHGIKGLVKVRSFTEAPEDIVAYGPLRDGAGRPVELSLKGPTKGGYLAAVPGVSSRNDAEALRGTQLFVERAMLPDLAVEDEEYYHADLIGLAVERTDGAAFGHIKAMHDFGAGDLLEILPAGSNETIMVSFDKAAVPLVDLARGRVVIADLPQDDDDTDDSADDGNDDGADSGAHDGECDE